MNGYCLINDDWTLSVQYRWRRFYYYYCYWPVESLPSIYYYVCTACQSYTNMYCIIIHVYNANHTGCICYETIVNSSSSPYAMCVQTYNIYYYYYFQTLFPALKFRISCKRMQICLIYLLRFNLNSKTTLF